MYSKTLLLCMVLLLVASCKRSAIDNSHPMFIKAQNCYNDGDYSDAINFYKRYLIVNPDSAKANYQLAAIYQEQGEYIQAIFYYEKYLTLKPESSDKKIVKEWIESSKQQLLKKLEKSTRADSVDTPQKLLEELGKLKIKK